MYTFFFYGTLIPLLIENVLFYVPRSLNKLKNSGIVKSEIPYLFPVERTPLVKVSVATS